ncbi:hypothetical protein [Actinomadura sp. RB99]|uniref:hypothetical protein n=1 Tax=Actinomadura sp. RB99 TaxID=2691577 RepID=UPI001686B70C|nr:hypothetical protein [Actinomadura sp. RB99]
MSAALLLTLTACEGKAPSHTAPAPSAHPASASAVPATSPASTAPPASSSSEPAGSATRPAAPHPKPASPSPKPVGPHTVCGEVKAANGELLAAAVQTGRTTCATVLRVLRAYYRPSTPKQGPADVATVDGWKCASNSSTESARTGRAASCRNGPTTIVADIIP